MRDKHDSRRSQVFARNRRLIDGHAEVLTRDRIFASRCAIFRDLAPAGLESLVRSARRRLIDKGEFFYRQGDPATDVYVLTDGTLKLVARSEDGRGVILDLVTPGQPFGHVAALVDGARLVSAVALEDSRALAWDTSAILRLMTTHPAVAVQAVRMMAEYARAEWLRANALMAECVERRVSRLLLKVAQVVGRNVQRRGGIELSLSVQDLAEMAFTTPVTVSRILARWKRRDLIEVGRGRIRILSLPDIATISQQP